MTGAHSLSVMLLFVVGTACKHVETGPGVQLTAAAQTAIWPAVDTAAFWNPSCDRRQIVVHRVDDSRMMVELSVCGEVRRYQRFTDSGGLGTWLDVTHLTEARPVPLG